MLYYGLQSIIESHQGTNKPISHEQCSKIISLLQQDDFSLTLQSIAILEALIEDESDFQRFWEVYTGNSIPDNPNIENLIDSIAQTQNMLSEADDGRLTYQTLWALGYLAQWNTQIVKNMTTIDLSFKTMITIPPNIANLQNIEYINLSFSSIQKGFDVMKITNLLIKTFGSTFRCSRIKSSDIVFS